MAYYGLATDKLNDRVTVVTGNIIHPRLGLDDETYTRLAQVCATVIHNAGCVDLTAPYEQLRPINVDGVRHIAGFAADGVLSQLIHVSSLGRIFRSMSLSVMPMI